MDRDIEHVVDHHAHVGRAEGVVEMSRQRVLAALTVLRTATVEDMSLIGALDDVRVALESDPLDSVVQAVARALIGAGDLAAHADDTSRVMVRRILDGELGQEAALAVTRLVLDLAHARGMVQALERETGRAP